MVNTVTTDKKPLDADGRNIEAIRQEAIRILAMRFGSLSLMSDYYFTAFMQENVPCMQLVLRAFMTDDSIVVKEVHVQHVTKNGLDGHGVRYDCLVHTESHGIFNVEIENHPNGVLELRLRYYAAMLDKENLKKNENYDKLPSVTNIIITPKDVEGKGRPLSFVGRVYMESATEVGEHPRRFEDKMLFVYVNALYKDTSNQIGRIIHDLTSSNNEPKLTEEFADAVDRYVRTEKGRVEMSGKIADYGIEAKDLEHLLSDVERKAAVEDGIRQGMTRGEKTLMDYILANGFMKRADMEAVFGQMGRPMPT